VRDFLALAFFLAVSCSAGWLGSLVTRPALDRWYLRLRKPAWTPPNWLFGPVWTVLYFLTGLAAWLVWREAGTGTWLTLYFLQLALNALWSILFFGLRRPDLALADIMLLWMAIVATLSSFARVDATAAWLLVPYLAWVSYAALLNWAFWDLNR